MDDKGTVMVGALGLPPITGSNPSARACVTAMKILRGIEVRSPVEATCMVRSPEAAWYVRMELATVQKPQAIMLSVR